MSPRERVAQGTAVAVATLCGIGTIALGGDGLLLTSCAVPGASDGSVYEFRIGTNAACRQPRYEVGEGFIPLDMDALTSLVVRRLRSSGTKDAEAGSVNGEWIVMLMRSGAATKEGYRPWFYVVDFAGDAGRREVLAVLLDGTFVEPIRRPGSKSEPFP